jgi:hypothetical protein
MTRVTRHAAAAVLTLVLAAGCTSFTPVDLTSLRDMGGVKPGDEVRVTTTDGQERQFEVTAVKPARIEGRRFQFNAWEIQTLERREFHAWRTVGAAGLLGGAAVAAASAGSAWFVITAF